MELTRTISDIVPITNEINVAIEKQGDMGQYWIDANEQLSKGYTLSVGQQNLLDDINAMVSHQFKQGLVDIPNLTIGSFNQLVKSVELDHLGLFLVRNGVSHHYHCTAGVEHPWRLEIDLKVLPTVHNKLGEPKAGLCFISAMVVTGDIYGTPVGQIPATGKVFQASKVIYIGAETVKIRHLPIITLANSNRPMTNHMLGSWLYFMRNVNYEDHLIMVDHDTQML